MWNIHLFCYLAKFLYSHFFWQKIIFLAKNQQVTFIIHNFFVLTLRIKKYKILWNLALQITHVLLFFKFSARYQSKASIPKLRLFWLTSMAFKTWKKVQTLKRPKKQCICFSTKKIFHIQKNTNTIFFSKKKFLAIPFTKENHCVVQKPYCSL